MTRTEFTTAFREALGDVDRDKAAGALMISRLTLERWYAGVSAPHRLARPSVFFVLGRLKDES